MSGRRSFPLRRRHRRQPIDATVDWLWPYWAERQGDPGSPAFIPRGHLPFPANVTARNWTMVGNLGSPHEAVVDRRGLVTPRPGGWSLDWWVGAEDRWHFPSREAAVRQSLLDGAPVVETAMRIPGGEAVHRAYAVRAASPGSTEELLVVEVENRSATPVALAFAVRPYNPEGLAGVERLAVDGLTVTADGRPALFLPRPPAGVAISGVERGDSVQDVVHGRTGEWPFPPLHDKAGLAQAAFVYPLPHRTSLRVAVPLVEAGPAPARARARLGAGAPAVGPAALHSAAEVARGWKAQLRRGLRFELPDARLQAAVDANRAYMLLFHEGDAITPGPFSGPRFRFREAAYQVTTLDRYGFHAEAAEVLRSYPGRQRRDGRFLAQSEEQDANGAAIYAIAEHHRLCGDDVAAAALPAVGRGVHWIAGQCRETPGDGAEARGLLPAGTPADHLGPSGRYYWDDFWGLRGLVDGAWLLRSVGREPAAAEADAAAAGLRRSISASLELAAARNQVVAMPAGPRRGIDAGMVGSLVACSPLRLLAPDDPWVTGTLDLARDRFCVGDAFFQSVSHTGLGTYLTLQLAFCELEAGDPRAARRLSWMLDTATETFTWPEAVHPRLGTGCAGDGHSGWAAADFLTFVRHSLVRELRGGGLALASLFPPEWAGLPLEVHQAPTHNGLVSFALRWHGERPALLWECEREGVTLTVPGLDPNWSTTDRTGEALLRPFRDKVRIPLMEG